MTPYEVVYEQQSPSLTSYIPNTSKVQVLETPPKSLMDIGSSQG